VSHPPSPRSSCPNIGAAASSPPLAPPPHRLLRTLSLPDLSPRGGSLPSCCSTRKAAGLAAGSALRASAGGAVALGTSCAASSSPPACARRWRCADAQYVPTPPLALCYVPSPPSSGLSLVTSTKQVRASLLFRSCCPKSSTQTLPICSWIFNRVPKPYLSIFGSYLIHTDFFGLLFGEKDWIYMHTTMPFAGSGLCCL
jgi:hypothetical protein